MQRLPAAMFMLPGFMKPDLWIWNLVCPRDINPEAILKRQRDIHESLISKGLGIISDSYLDRLEKRCQEAKVLCVRKNREGKNFAEILKEIDQGGYDLTVMGGLGMGVVENSQIGSVCERVARKTSKDILIVKQPFFNLVPVDLKQGSELHNILVA